MIFGWPDLLIGAILLLAALKGYKRGFIGELAGGVALLLALITPWLYNGAFDGFFESALHLPAGAAHVVAMFAVGLATYVAVLIVARVLSAVARVPVLGFGNAAGGLAVGFAKAAIAVWIALYVVLFFPLSSAIRAELHRSPLVALLTQGDAQVDDAITATLPGFARGLVRPLFQRHRV